VRDRHVGLRGQSSVEAPAADHGPHVVGAGPAGDAEQPGPYARSPLEPRQRPERPQERLLGQIVRGAGVDERGREAPHLGLSPPDEGSKSTGITRPGGQRERGDRVVVDAVGRCHEQE
jgi:hypothetical protein